jgi:molybdopterin molybdotransferase
MQARDPSCEDDFDNASLSCEEALRRILANVDIVSGHERVHLRSALGRILAEQIVSPIDVPTHTNSAMDGYAIAGGDVPERGERRFAVVGTAFAGRPFNASVSSGQTVRIMTGAAMPENTDTVVMQEHAQISADGILIDGNHKRGQHVRAAGEDLSAGAIVLEVGHCIGPAELGLIASLGVGEVSVRRRVRVAYFSTGDELRSIGEQLGLGEIYDSNRYTLYAMLSRAGVDVIDMGVVRDTRDAVASALSEAAANADVVITSGGVSVGEADFVKEVVESLGEVGFWKVAMKPGRPLAFGKIGDTRFFGLPGNPVSVMVTYYQFVEPALVKMSGGSIESRLETTAVATEPLKKRPGRTEYQRGILSRGDDGSLRVRGTGDQGSGILHSMSIADCFIVLPMASAGVEAGATVTVQPFLGIL